MHNLITKGDFKSKKLCVFALEYSSEDLLHRKRACDNEEDEIKLTSSPKDSFMFAYQSIHMARLSKKYGNEMCLLTQLTRRHKTARFSLS